MGNETVTATDSAVVDSAMFSEVAIGYSAHSALIDALIKAENPDSAFKAAKEVIGLLVNMSENGKRYTPDKSLGFGSDNAASIADKILGRAPTTAQVRKCLKAAGKRG